MTSTAWVMVFMIVGLNVKNPQYFEYQFANQQECERQAVAVLHDPFNPIDYVKCVEINTTNDKGA